jgi:hypothetical protein
MRPLDWAVLAGALAFVKTMRSYATDLLKTTDGDSPFFPVDWKPVRAATRTFAP